MKFILGKKIEMTQKFKENGKAIPVTVIEAGPCFITQIKTKEKEGYEAVRIGFGFKKKINKPLKGHLEKIKNEKLKMKNGGIRWLREFRVPNPKLKVGEAIDVSIFQKGDKVKISGISKGKGFQGVVKRHGFHGSPASHGHKDQLRMPGSIGATDAARVFKGTRMAGRMGGERVTVKNLEIIEINKDKNLLIVKGAVPGARNSLVEIRGD
ncbi:MAG: 50S ribosomal protein L3 [Parcubacteria group bacterium CG23_combo_of_CG06-09_8_20_14_all_35_9]|nr:MAG: 50S ribosomal protein L3 [Parcubacteria group bacterium CG23_combo_of_CG06-09_8_20_14_all_35_9]